MRRTRTIHAGPARDEIEATLHAEEQRCPGCGGALGLLFETPLAAPFALRLQLRCVLCQEPVRFDYLPGRGWDTREERRGLERALRPGPSLLLDAAFLERRLAAALARLGQDGDAAPGLQLQDALEGIEALWELEKLPDAPAERRHPDNVPCERLLLDRYRAAGGRVPDSLASRLASVDTRAATDFDATAWVMAWGADDAAFAAAELPGVSPDVADELRFSVGNVLRLLHDSLAAAVERSRAWKRVDTPAPRPIVLADALGVLERVVTVLRDAAAPDFRNSVEFELRCATAVDAYFLDLGDYQHALQRAADAYPTLAQDGIDELLLSSSPAFGPYAGLVRRAALEMPDWPLDFGTVASWRAVDAAVEEIEALSRRAAAAGAPDRREAFRRALDGLSP